MFEGQKCLNKRLWPVSPKCDLFRARFLSNWYMMALVSVSLLSQAQMFAAIN